ncbi:hypothetical protein [Luteimonas sp. 3794]|uniref:hypothetical protein n=1 Tax=Luteimonas sp. 3794 TaxID=2817730 RepID=UPI00285C2562|nr:hypothetical protein [Luteimonas sp. 3794]MDR6993104.1 hypothetical protein [Luteimonas sp. 3794]
MKPHDESREPDAVPGKTTAADPDAGLDREVGDLEDEDDEDALPGRAGGGLAGG